MADPEARDGRAASGRDRELGHLLRLVASLGAVVVLGIGACFALGLYAERRWHLHGVGVVVALLAGVGLSLYWAYARIGRHLERFAPSADQRACAHGGEAADACPPRRSEGCETDEYLDD